MAVRSVEGGSIKEVNPYPLLVRKFQRFRGSPPYFTFTLSKYLKLQSVSNGTSNMAIKRKETCVHGSIITEVKPFSSSSLVTKPGRAAAPYISGS